MGRGVRRWWQGGGEAGGAGLAVGLLVLGALALAVGAGCSDEAASAPCVADADCASGECRADGTCAPVEDDAMPTFPESDGGGDLGGDEGAGGAGGAGGSGGQGGAGGAGGSGPDAASDSAEPKVCVPNDDGTIDSGEVPVVVGGRLTFRVAADAAVDLVGEQSGEGTMWDLAGELPGDHDIIVEALDPEDWWFAGAYPDATYAARLSDTDDLMGVFQATEDALLLLAVVSPDDGLLRTQLDYVPPAKVLEFPLEPGQAWESTSTVSGFTSGTPTLATETYTSEVDAEGTLETPYATFAVLRVRTHLQRLANGVPWSERQVLFVTECFGTIASVRSAPFESAPEFSEAVEVRRLAP